MDDPDPGGLHSSTPHSGTGDVPSGHGPRTTDHVSPDDPPPFGASWRALYVVVAGTLAALIALFALFTRTFE